MAERIRCLVCNGAGHYIVGDLSATKSPYDPIPTQKIDCKYCNGTGYIVTRDRVYDKIRNMRVSDLAMAAAKEAVTMSIHALRCYGIEISETRRKAMEHTCYHHYLQLLQLPEQEYPHEN